MSTLVDYVRSGEPDLTNRQMALLLLVYLNPGPHTVRGLARALNVSKPVVTRALNRLGALGYLRRQRDDSDKRNIFVARTSEGAEFLEEFGQFIGDGDGASAHRPAIGGQAARDDHATDAHIERRRERADA
nr:MarR family transcriptional regulator [Sphingomonas lenta]